MSSAQLTRQILPLTSLRFFAAAAVVLHHGRDAFQQALGFLNGVQLALGVSFFFVLSGFILTHVHHDLSGPEQIKKFYVSRIARIWPTHLFTFALVILLVPTSLWFMPHMEKHGVMAAAANLTLIQSWIPMVGFYFSINGVSWSISTEMFFYLLFPWLIAGWNRTWHWKTALAAGLLVGILAVSIALPVPELDINKPLTVSSHGLLYGWPLARLFEFTVGMCMALLYRRLDPIAGGLSRYGWLALELCMPLVLWAAWKGWWHAASAVFSPIPRPFFSMPAGFMTVAFGLAVLVFALSRGPVAACLSWRPLVVLGEASFSLYMVHQIVMNVVIAHHGWMEAPSQWALFGLIVVVALSLSLLMWTGIEMPAKRAIVAWAGSRRAVVPPRQSAG